MQFRVVAVDVRGSNIDFFGAKKLTCPRSVQSRSMLVTLSLSSFNLRVRKGKGEQKDSANEWHK